MEKTKHPYLTMMSLYLGAFVGMFGETALNIALPQLSAAFSVDTSLMQWMVIGHMLVIGLVLPFASPLMKWFPIRKLVLFALGAVLLLLLTTSATSPIWLVILCHMILLIGVPLAMSPSQTSGLNSLPPELSTDGSTILNTMQQVWGAVCTAVATSLLGIGRNAFTGDDPTGALSFTNGFHCGLYFTLALAVVGLIIALTLPGKKKQR